MSRVCKWAFVLIVVAFVAAQFGCATKEVMGNKGSKVYHACDCKCIEKMKDENKRPFASEDAARKDGYRPCKMCFGGKSDTKPAPKKPAKPKKPGAKKAK